MNVLLWHVHGSWTTAFVQGDHRYLIPVLPDRGPDGRGRACTWDWPASVEEVPPERLAHQALDVVVVQRPEELALADRWLGGRRLGRDLPFVYLEHNAPQGRIADLVHPVCDRRDTVLVHVTAHNALFWDAGTTPSRIIEHGVVDPGHRFVGDRAAAAVVVNEPVRRGRVVGTDLLAPLSRHVDLDVFGLGTDELARADTPGVRPSGAPEQARLHDAMARRRVYLHPFRWTSLGLSLVEAMLLGMPVVALATTEVPRVVPAAAGVVSNRLDEVAAGLRRFASDPDEGRACGEVARRAALDHFGLGRFLADWDRLLEEVTS